MNEYRSSDGRLWRYSEWSSMVHQGEKCQGVWIGAFELSTPAGECAEEEFRRMLDSIERLTREQMAERYPDSPLVDLGASTYEVPTMITRGR